MPQISIGGLTRYQCIMLRSELNILRERLRDSESQKESYRNSLVALESKIERLQSKTVLAIESRGSNTETKGQEVENERKEEVQTKPSSPVVSGLVIA